MKYSKEFKEEALKLSDEIGLKKAAQQLGIQYYTLSDWRSKRNAAILDCFNGEIVAFEMRDNMKKELCIDTVKQLREKYGRLDGTVLHSDRGSMTILFFL